MALSTVNEKDVLPAADKAPARLPARLNVIDVEPTAETISCPSAGLTVIVTVVEPLMLTPAARFSVPGVTVTTRLVNDDIAPGLYGSTHDDGAKCPEGTPASLDGMPWPTDWFIRSPRLHMERKVPGEPPIRRRGSCARSVVFVLRAMPDQPQPTSTAP